jgi:hypothetical protein
MNLNSYFDQLKAAGLKVVAGSKNTIWRSHERFSMIRQPSCALHVPSGEEIRSVFRESHAAMLSFTVNPSAVWIPNGRLYICTDPDYSLEKLKSARTVRRGLNEFDLRFMDQSEILQLGKQAYCDTLVRTGLSVQHRRSFESAFSRPRHDTKYLGAIKGNRLGAFLIVTEVDDWVSMGGYSADEFLPYRPNDALVFYASHHYLVERKFRVVDYGLSSIQSVSNAEGLHRFKIKMGFRSVPVHRAFVVNPLLRPLVNRFSWTLVNNILKLSPNHPMLKKAEGALKGALQKYN